MKNCYVVFNGDEIDKTYILKRKAKNREAYLRRRNRHLPPTHYFWRRYQITL